jgi:hypothetical protein
MAPNAVVAEGVEFELAAWFSLISRSLSAIEPSLQPVSPENGHNAEDGRRFPAQQTE